MFVSQGAPSGQPMPMSSYPPRAAYMHPWTGQPMYTPAGPTPEESKQMQLMYQHYQQTQMQPNASMMQRLTNPPRMLNPAHLNLNYSVASPLQRNAPPHGLTNMNHHNLSSTSHMSGSIGREGSSRASGGNGYSAPTEASTTRMHCPTSTSGVQSTEQFYFFP